MSLIPFDTPIKHQKARGFLIFSGGIKRDQWHETGEDVSQISECASDYFILFHFFQNFMIFVQVTMLRNAK